jgi:glycosyltransferase-like protein
VGLFTYSTLPRGSVVHTAYLADALHTAGCDVTVYALDKERRGFFRPLRAHLRLVPASATPPSTAELVRVRASELADFLARIGPRHDVYHAEDCLTANALLDFRARGNRIDVIRTVHHVENFDDRHLARCEERSIREPALCLTVSALVGRDLLRLFGVRAARVGNGVSAERFSQAYERRISACMQEHAIERRPLLLSVGGVEERKNTLRILRAFERLRERHPNARWWILGGATVLDHGAYRAVFDRALQSLSPATRSAVTELGVVADHEVPALFGSADVLVYPSLQEGFGLAALEALAAGLPLVASRRAPFTEFLDDSCATLVDPESHEAIAGGVEAALNTGATRRECGRARAAAYSWRAVAALHLEYYQRLGGSGVDARFRAASYPL